MTDPLLTRDVRLWGGPHDGKIMSVPYGQYIIRVRHPAAHEPRAHEVATYDGSLGVTRPEKTYLTYSQTMQRDGEGRLIYRIERERRS